MRDENDWRLTGQEEYLKGVQLWWRPYARYSESWEHDHCELCWAKFMQEDHPDVLREGYATEDKYRWICEQCFEDFKDLMEWGVMAIKPSAEPHAIQQSLAADAPPRCPLSTLNERAAEGSRYAVLKSKRRSIGEQEFPL